MTPDNLGNVGNRGHTDWLRVVSSAKNHKPDRGADAAPQQAVIKHGIEGTYLPTAASPKLIVLDASGKEETWYCFFYKQIYSMLNDLSGMKIRTI